MDSHLDSIRDVWIERSDRARLGCLKYRLQFGEERVRFQHLSIRIDALERGSQRQLQCYGFLRGFGELVLDKLPGRVRVLRESINAILPSAQARVAGGIASAIEHVMDLELAGNLGA